MGCFRDIIGGYMEKNNLGMEFYMDEIERI